MHKCQAIIFLCFTVLLGGSCTTNNGEEMAETKDPKSIFEADDTRPRSEQIWSLTARGQSAGADTLTWVAGRPLTVRAPYLLQSPKFAIDPLTYYRLDFTAQTAAKAMWAMVFFDSLDQVLMADVYSSFDPNDSFEKHTYYLQSKTNAATAQLWIRPIEDSTSVQLQRVRIGPDNNPQSIIAWADSIYNTMPPLGNISIPLDNRDEYLPKTMLALEKGTPLRIVMLGNSIINDTGNSGWEQLLHKQYPGADVKVITSVRGGTGCWYYRENNRIDTFVLQYEPDLLVIGGISHREDTAAIRSVIDQVRARRNAEILVMSGPVGRQGDPRSNSAFTIPPDPASFRLQLKQMSADAAVAYFDMQTEWGKYIQASGKPYDYYLRDPVHANARGRQVLARLLTTYFEAQ